RGRCARPPSGGGGPRQASRHRPVGDADQRRGAGGPVDVGKLRHALPEPARTDRPRLAARGIHRNASLDETHGDRASLTQIPHPGPNQRAGGGTMSTGLNLALLSGGLLSLGVVLLIARFVPAEPDLAEALARLTPGRTR